MHKILKVIVVLVALYFIYTAFSLLIELGLMEQYELKGPDTDAGGIFIDDARRQTEIDTTRRFLIQHLVASFGLIGLLFFIKNTKANRKDDVLDS